MIKMSRKKYFVSILMVLVFIPVLLFAKKEVLIDLSLQKVYAMEDGMIVFDGRISSGKSGYETPTGKFAVLQKKRKHKSNLYPKPDGGAKMPYMMRLTWDGIAMHQGYVPKKPASHGCIRLQRRFAKKLFQWVDKGTPVSVEGDAGNYLGYTKSTVYEKDKDGYSIIEVY